jgi:hypothetical protein
LTLTKSKVAFTPNRRDCFNIQSLGYLEIATMGVTNRK